MKWPIVTAITLSLIIISIAKPDILANNTFLNDLVSHEILSILIVLLTITMASVANIHLALGRIKKKLSQNGIDISDAVTGARSELSQNAWYLFGLFCIMIIVLIIKGCVNGTNYIAYIHATALVILTFNMAILYDIYMSVYELTSLDDPPHDGQHGDDGSEIP